jgi:hypothetical protein
MSDSALFNPIWEVPKSGSPVSVAQARDVLVENFSHNTVSPNSLEGITAAIIYAAIMDFLPAPLHGGQIALCLEPGLEKVMEVWGLSCLFTSSYL